MRRKPNGSAKTKSASGSALILLRIENRTVKDQFN